MTRDALLAAIYAAPDDDEPRRVYADWLLQQGDKRGEFIQLQLASAKTPDQIKREREHMPTGEHRNFVTPFPDWVDEVTAKIADAMTPEAARAQHAWIDATNRKP